MSCDIDDGRSDIDDLRSDFDNLYCDKCENVSVCKCGDITKREWFAGLVMQGVLSTGPFEIDAEKRIPKFCFDMADAMLEEGARGE